MTRVDYCTNITSTIFGMVDKTVTLFMDFECEVEIAASLEDGELSMHCTDVFVSGTSLRNGDGIAAATRLQVMEEVDRDLKSYGTLFQQVRLSEGYVLSGSAADPDTVWMEAAE